MKKQFSLDDLLPKTIQPIPDFSLELTRTFKKREEILEILESNQMVLPLEGPLFLYRQTLVYSIKKSFN